MKMKAQGKIATSVERLFKGYYGAGGNCASDAVRVQALFATYYGKRVACWRDNRPASMVVSRSFDNGETLGQRIGGKGPGPGQDFGGIAAPAPAFEEYVVDKGSVALATSLSGRVEVVPPEEISVHQEYRVDLLEPLADASAPRPANAVMAAPGEAARRAPVVPRSPAPAALPARSYEEKSEAKATDDDFIADMQSILTGRAVFDPRSGRTVSKDKLGQPGPIQTQPPASPRPDTVGPLPEANNSQAIFDRIAQSMEFANTYDLGTVELNNRFADFDKTPAPPQKAPPRVQTTRSHNSQVPATGEALSFSRASLEAAELLADLDAIQRPSRSTAQSAAGPGTGAGQADLSRPLYDAGEHVLTAADLYVDRLRVGQAPGVPLSYGQIVAMGDLYESVDQIARASAAELTKIKSLLERSTAYYKGNKAQTSLDISDEMWDAATMDRYLELAEQNYEHFSPNMLFKTAGFAKVVNRYGNNKSAWEAHHRRAIEEAQKMFLTQQSPNTSLFLEWPLIINAFGDHFLTDAFSAGHAINKEETIEYFKSNFFDGKSLKPAAEDFFAGLAALAFKGDLKKRFSVLETYEPVLLWWNPNIDTENAFRKLLITAAEQQPDQIANLAVKALHDRLNKDGLEVSNDAGDGIWRLTGDGYLDAKNLVIIRKAVQQSVDNLYNPAIRASNLDFEPLFASVWKHVPRLTDASQAKVAQLTSDYARPDSALLKAAAADLIGRKVNSLIKKLKREKKLKDA